ncbi:hypothetical protein GGF32_000925 [Allomyces javanicus]|nr:hypothetical protein GGF32_000925 [Allomyces javanicus]
MDLHGPTYCGQKGRWDCMAVTDVVSETPKRRERQSSPRGVELVGAEPNVADLFRSRARLDDDDDDLGAAPVRTVALPLEVDPVVVPTCCLQYLHRSTLLDSPPDSVESVVFTPAIDGAATPPESTFSGGGEKMAMSLGPK